MGRKGVKTGGRDWQPGQSGNPKGGKKLPKDLREFIGLDAEVDSELVRKIISAYLLKTAGEIQELENDPEISTIERIVISLIKGAIVYSCPKRGGVLFDRLIGKATEGIRYTGNNGGSFQYSHLSDAEFVEHCKESMAELKDLLGEGNESTLIKKAS